jgi:hypothetical protein
MRNDFLSHYSITQTLERERSESPRPVSGNHALHHITDEPWNSEELIRGFSRARSHGYDQPRLDNKRQVLAVPAWKEHEIQPC